MSREILLVRHGETQWNREGRVQGWAPVSLNATGAGQAERVGEYLGTRYQVGAVYSSDLQRAVETADLVREAGGFTDVPVSATERLRERNFGVFQGLDSHTLFSRYKEYAIGDRGMVAARNEPELGESYVDFDRRVVDYWTELTADLAAPTTLVVTHGGVIRQVIAHIRGYDVVRAVEEIELENGCLTVVRPGEDGGSVVSQNVSHFL